MRNTEKKSNKFVVLATYGFAVLCLLLGLFLPLFNGKDVLALKLLEVFKSLANKESEFDLAYHIKFFGMGKAFDFMALVVVLYTLVTVVALAGLVPAVLSVVRKNGKLAKKIYYGVEIAALIVLSLFFVIALQEWVNCYNMVIAICGTFAALLALRTMDKGKKAAVKIALFVLSAIGFLALFNFVSLLEKQAEFNKLSQKVSSGMVETSSGANYLTLLFTEKFSDVFRELSEAKYKALIIFAEFTATVVLINFFIDAVRMATRKDKKVGCIFNLVRFGLEFVLAICLLATALICKTNVGMMLIVILIVAAMQVGISVVKFVNVVLKKSDNNKVAEKAQQDTVEPEAPEAFGNEEPTADVYADEEFVEPQFVTEEYNADETYESFTPTAPADEVAENDEEEDDNDGYVSPEEDMQAHPAETVNTEEPVSNEDGDEIDYEIKTDGTYLLPPDETVKEPEDAPVEEAPAEEPVEEIAADELAEEAAEVETVEEAVEEIAKEPPAEEPVEEIAAEEPAEEVAEIETVEEAVEEIAEEPPAEEPVEEIAAEEPVETIEEVTEQPAVEEPVEEAPAEEERKDYREEIKPYNPYEKRNENNPFRPYE